MEFQFGPGCNPSPNPIKKKGQDSPKVYKFKRNIKTQALKPLYLSTFGGLAQFSF